MDVRTCRTESHGLGEGDMSACPLAVPDKISPPSFRHILAMAVIHATAPSPWSRQRSALRPRSLQRTQSANSEARSVVTLPPCPARTVAWPVWEIAGQMVHDGNGISEFSVR